MHKLVAKHRGKDSLKVNRCGSLHLKVPASLSRPQKHLTVSCSSWTWRGVSEKAPWDSWHTAGRSYVNNCILEGLYAVLFDDADTLGKPLPSVFCEHTHHGVLHSRDSDCWSQIFGDCVGQLVITVTNIWDWHRKRQALPWLTIWKSFSPLLINHASFEPGSRHLIAVGTDNTTKCLSHWQALKGSEDGVETSKSTLRTWLQSLKDLPWDLTT